LAPVVALTGFMGSGKSSVGVAAAALLGWSFVDLDVEVERSLGATVADVFSTKGEEFFRKAELDTLRSVLGDRRFPSGLVLALGGGTLMSSEAADLVREAGAVIYLQLDPTTAWERVKASDRPLAQDEDAFWALFASRAHFYEGSADAVVAVGQKSVDHLAQEVATLARRLTREVS
jgi:shikimate kinase